GRQLSQMYARALIAAVLRPHHRKNPELGQRRFASEGSDDAVVLEAGEAVTFENSGFDAHDAAVRTPPWAATAERTDSNNTRPSALPRTGSHARSGCGISPTTLRPGLQMPAMLLTLPFGFRASVISPSGSQYRKITRRD